MPTKIPWCDATINPVVECSKCSPGCDNCYAEKMAYRLSRISKTAAKYTGVIDKAGRWTGKISRPDFSVFDRLPEKPCSVFVGSMTDLFHTNAIFGDAFLVDLLARIKCEDHHNYLFLTKRPDNMKMVMNKYFHNCNDHGILENLWLGVTVCNQEEANYKIFDLIETPAKNRFLSIEPMLGPIDLKYFLTIPSLYKRHINAVIVGGETGPEAGPCTLIGCAPSTTSVRRRGCRSFLEVNHEICDLLTATNLDVEIISMDIYEATQGISWEKFLRKNRPDNTFVYRYIRKNLRL